MLQLAAATMDPSAFLIALLDKFQLIGWADKEFDAAEDDSIRQITTLAEEFLSTLITILGERYTPGVGRVTAEEALKKEIIQLLCVEPMGHSTLNRSLSEDLNRETGLEKVVESVAVFKKPANGKGVYELRPEYLGDYNVFFYHFSKVSEVIQCRNFITPSRGQYAPFLLFGACNPLTEVIFP